MDSERQRYGTEEAFAHKILPYNLDNYEGYSSLKGFLKQQKARGMKRVPRLMLKYFKNETANKSANEITSVSFAYEDCPLPGWRKELVVRLSGKTAGRLDVSYMTPLRDTRLKNRGEILSYLIMQNKATAERASNSKPLDSEKDKPLSSDTPAGKVPMEVVIENPQPSMASSSGAAQPELSEQELNEKADLFDFKVVFCVCQNSEDPYRNYVECSYGKIGCNKWIHPECVGLGSRGKEELDTFPKVICPFCTFYIRGCKTEKFVPPHYRMLDQYTPGYTFHDTYLPNGELIEEMNCPHHIWGLSDFQKTYFAPTDIVGEIAFSKNSSSSVKSSQNMRQSTSSSSSAPPPSQADRSVIQVINREKHISEWRRRLFDDSSQRWITIGLTGGYVVGEDDQPDQELMRQRIRAKVEERRLVSSSSARSLLLAPSMRYKRIFDELVCRSFLNPQLNKRRYLSTNQLYNFAPIAFNNLEDGGIRVITAATASKSLHDLCKNGLCALCFQPLLQLDTINGSDSPVSVPLTELSYFGAVSYELHRHCAFLVSREEELTKAVQSLFQQQEKPGESKTVSETAIGSSPKLCRYFYDDIDDQKCAYCQKPGAVLFTWQSPAEGEVNLHLLCLFSFIHYRRLPQLSSSSSSSIVVANSQASATSKDKEIEMTEEEGRRANINTIESKEIESESVSTDVLANTPQCRCMICGVREGHILRCCGANCHIRAHLLCASSTKEWKIITLSNPDVPKIRTINSLGFVCSTHRVFDSTIEDEEEIDYFQK